MFCTREPSRAGGHRNHAYALVTKPWALDAKDADFIIEEAKQAKEKFGVSLMPFLPQHCTPISQKHPLPLAAPAPRLFFTPQARGQQPLQY